MRAPLYTPSRYDAHGPLNSGVPVAVSREVMADLDTPVSAYLKVRGSGPSFLLESVEGGQRIGRYSFIGTRPRRVLRIKDGRQQYDGEVSENCTDPLSAVRSMMQEYGSGPPQHARFDGGAVGYLSYETARYFERLPAARCDPLGLPDAVFLDVDTLLVFDHVRHTVRILSHAWPLNGAEAAYRQAVERIEELAALLEAPLGNAPLPSPCTVAPASNLTQSLFESMVTGAQEHIRAGDILQAVLSQRLSMPLTGDPFGFYRRLRVVSPSPYMYYLDFGDHQLAGASPELLIQLEGTAITSRPIAGTRRRGVTAEEDSILAAELLADEKERAEHLMLVDLARNDVGRVSRPGSVQVPTFMGVQHFSHVMHLVSDVTGELDPGSTMYDVLRAAFPAGTVSGAPKIRAMEIIAALEQDRRGPYAGTVGFFGKGNALETAITIRTGLVQDGTLHVQAGAGIVADSIPEREYEETLNKARALLLAAGGVT